MKSPTLTVLAITSGNILGPLLLFGGIGWYLSNLKNNNAYVVAGIIIAFLFTNFLIFTTTTKYLRSTAQKVAQKHVGK
ncbi:MAG: hypothetical protein ACD_43C00024G0004 [uncultured bacterium]|nr:MAG: hypothetical protein ACD_43C00024G0004 [uncultured bacterium]